MELEKIRDNFLKDVSMHSLVIDIDQGNHRCLTFSKNNSSFYKFILTTWPGYLSISGDVGTYVFSRIPDMFEFFRGKNQELEINPMYWGSKLESIGRNSGYKEFTTDSLCKSLNQYFELIEDWNYPVSREECWDEIERGILDVSGSEVEAYVLLQEFNYKGFHFEDLSLLNDFTVYTHPYLWCLHAIVWGIQQYDNKVVITNG